MKFFSITFFLLVIFQSNSVVGQGMADMIIKGSDWRICGTYLEKDTLEFKKVESKVAMFDCGKQYTSQLLFSADQVFRFLLWDDNIVLLDISGNFELNDANGEIRFYFEDGTSRDFILSYLNNKKMVLIDKNY